MEKLQPPALVNGDPGGQIDVTDRGLAYGDGVFETVAVENGRPQLWPAHRARLLAGCEALGIAFDQMPALEGEVASTARACGQGVLKIIVTRGCGARGYRPPADVQPTRIVFTRPPADYPEALHRDGVAARFCRRRLARDYELAGVKHLNRLAQVSARREWGDEYHEGLMLDDEGFVVEGTMSNLFIISNGALQTPLLDRCGVRGVMRGWIIGACRARGIEVGETRLTPQAVLDADGAFLCNVLIRAWPIRRLDERSYDVAAAHTLLDKLPLREIT